MSTQDVGSASGRYPTTQVRCDKRVGGKVKYYLGHDDEHLMFIPGEVRKCVAFLYCKHSAGMEPQGTAFFVSVPFDGLEDGEWVYLVTSRHVIEGIKDKSSDRKVWVRVNLRAGGTRLIASDLAVWDRHPDESVEVAIAHVQLNEEYDHRSFPIAGAATVGGEPRISPGQDLFIMGLFTHHRGDKTNIPIVRIGNIAAMPEEPIFVTTYGVSRWMDAYLIESRSFGGLSGSPVFVRPEHARLVNGELVFDTGGVGFYLLGLVFGHYHEKQAGRVIVEEEATNLGIAIVVPVEKIIDMVNDPDRVKWRSHMSEEMKKRTAPVPDKTNKAMTEEEFKETLKLVSRKISPPDREEKET